jgi:acyl carrier protein
VNRTLLIEKVKAVTAQHLKIDVKDISEDTEFVADLKVDSLNLIELIMLIEESFDAKFPEDESLEIKTIGQAVDKIERSINLSSIV